MCTEVVGDTGRGRVKSGQEELRARPGPLLCHAYESQGIKSRISLVIQNLSEDMVEEHSEASPPLPQLCMHN